MKLTLFPSRRHFRVLFIGLVAVLLTSGTFAEDKDEHLCLATGVDHHGGVDGIYAQFSKAYRTLDASLIANFYTEDAYYLAPGKDLLHGRKSIEENYAEFFDGVKKRQQRMEISFEVLSRETDGKRIFDVGIYTLRFFGTDREATSRGKFVTISLCEEEQCRFQVDSFSGLPPREEPRIYLPES